MSMRVESTMKKVASVGFSLALAAMLSPVSAFAGDSAQETAPESDAPAVESAQAAVPEDDDLAAESAQAAVLEGGEAAGGSAAASPLDTQAIASEEEGEEAGSSSIGIQAVASEDAEEDGASKGSVSTQATESSSSSSDASSSSSASTGSVHAPSVAGPHTVSWANTAADAKDWFGDELAVLPNGTAELVSVKLASGTTLKKADIPEKAGADKVSFSKGVLDAPAGSTITMKLLPARGYQLLSTKINDTVAITPSSDDEQVGVYSFAMPSEGIALDCGFTTASDKVESDSDDVKSGTLADAEEVVSTGTLLLSISDADDDAAAGLKDAAKKLGASDSDVVASLDLTLENIVNQGAADSSWDTELTDLPSAVSLTLTLSDEAAEGASSFYIIREHDGAYQQAAVDYDAVSKTITFKSNAFSDYAVVKGTPDTSGTSNNSNSTGSTTPKTGDTNDASPLLTAAALSAALVVVSGRRVRKLGR